MRVVKFFIAGLICLTSSAAMSAVEEHLFTLSCTAKSYLYVSVDVNSGKLVSQTRDLASAPFEVKISQYEGVLRVYSPQYDFISYFTNVYRNPEQVKRVRFNESLGNGLVVEAKDTREYSTLDVSDYGLFLTDVSGTLKVSRGIRIGGISGFFTETFSGETRTLSFACDQYNQSQWRTLTKPLYDYVLPSLKQDKH